MLTLSKAFEKSMEIRICFNFFLLLLNIRLFSLKNMSLLFLPFLKPIVFLGKSFPSSRCVSRIFLMTELNSLSRTGSNAMGLYPSTVCLSLKGLGMGIIFMYLHISGNFCSLHVLLKHFEMQSM